MTQTIRIGDNMKASKMIEERKKENKKKIEYLEKEAEKACSEEYLDMNINTLAILYTIDDELQTILPAVKQQEQLMEEMREAICLYCENIEKWIEKESREDCNTYDFFKELLQKYKQTME
jgi:hypothetical protein